MLWPSRSAACRSLRWPPPRASWRSWRGRYRGDPFVAKLCPRVRHHEPAPATWRGIGDEAIHCDVCGSEVSAFRVANGYVIVLDREAGVSLTVGKAVADKLAGEAGVFSALPEAAEQHSILALAHADIAGLAAHMQPFLGNIGTTPSADLPDSHNAGDFGALPHRRAAQIRADGGGPRRRQDRWPHGHQLRARGGHSHLSGEGEGGPASTWATCTPSRAMARSPATHHRRLRRDRGGGRGHQGPVHRRAPILLQRPDDLPPMAPADDPPVQKAAVKALGAPLRPDRGGGERAPSPSSARRPISTTPPGTAWSAPPPSRGCPTTRS